VSGAKPIYGSDKKFELVSKFKPSGGQPEVIDSLLKSISSDVKHQILLGITGSGKTFTVANLIQELNRPALIMAPNKTLAAQLYMEFRDLFPNNAVEYFVSYYDYYQPEAYVASTDTFIEKDSAINDTIDKMRHSATRSLLERRDVIIVSSVSCIYGLGSPEAYYGMLLHLNTNQKVSRDEVISKLVEIRYTRRDDDFSRGNFRVRGDVIEVFPASEEKRAIRIELFGDVVDSISEIDPINGRRTRKLDRVTVFPTSHFITSEENMARALKSIRAELGERLIELKNEEKVLEAKRLEQRTRFDLEMMEHVGFCSGIENYSRHLTGRKEGETPYTLLDYFPDDFLLFVDESHVTVPQIGGMYHGDRSRKEVLVSHGFRLPSALDNRPLNFDEFSARIDQTVYVSATPGKYEIGKSGSDVFELIIRPTGLLDPKIEVKPATHQVDHLIPLLKEQEKKKERTLVTTLTKRSAENLSEYLQSLNIRVRYLHSDIDTMERSQLLKDLRLGVYDVLVGINLLREGLDLPEVSLVTILDADKEGFLRSTTSLLQTCGRAARNLNGRVVMFADEVTKSMKECIEVTERRRKIQQAHNEKEGISPAAIYAKIHQSLHDVAKDQGYLVEEVAPDLEGLGSDIEKLEKDKKEAVKNLDFERAAQIRDRIASLKNKVIFDGKN
jgi:excinuclease ABC subunit B